MTLDRRLAHAADMLDFVRELRQLLSDMTLDEYLGQRVLNLAVEKLFINLGEAACRMGPDAPSVMPALPWRQMIGLRNILAHGYEQVTHETLYRTVVEELAAVESGLLDWLGQQGSGEGS